MKKFFTLLLMFNYSAHAVQSKIEEKCTRENEKHLPTEFLEYKQYFPQSQLPIWMQQRCAYVINKAHLTILCKPLKMSEQEIAEHGYNNAFATSKTLTIHLNDGHHSDLSFEESMFEIGHEVGHVYDNSHNIARIAIPIGLFTASLLCVRKSKKIYYCLQGMSGIGSISNFYLDVFGTHLREKYADLKGTDFIKDVASSDKAIRHKAFDNAVPSSTTHPSGVERAHCIQDYEEWKKKNITSPSLFLLYDTLFKTVSTK